jgi:hypothetical protein
VRDQHERGALGSEPVEQLDHLAAGGLVEVAGGLVGEDDQWPLGDCACDRDPLTFAA